MCPSASSEQKCKVIHWCAIYDAIVVSLALYFGFFLNENVCLEAFWSSGEFWAPLVFSCHHCVEFLIEMGQMEGRFVMVLSTYDSTTTTLDVSTNWQLRCCAQGVAGLFGRASGEKVGPSWGAETPGAEGNESFCIVGISADLKKLGKLHVNEVQRPQLGLNGFWPFSKCWGSFWLRLQAPTRIWVVITASFSSYLKTKVKVNRHCFVSWNNPGDG